MRPSASDSSSNRCGSSFGVSVCRVFSFGACFKYTDRHVFAIFVSNAVEKNLLGEFCSEFRGYHETYVSGVSASSVQASSVR